MFKKQKMLSKKFLLKKKNYKIISSHFKKFGRKNIIDNFFNKKDRIKKIR